jgi:radical SAM superfamily enzyme YgiQ (UPF0313 family)
MRVFYFVDEAIAPRTAMRIADAIARERLPWEWFSEARFERQLDEATLRTLHAGGCRMLLFGLESSVQRMLDLMDKGITPERVVAILRACTAADIRSSCSSPAFRRRAAPKRRARSGSSKSIAT